MLSRRGLGLEGHKLVRPKSCPDIRSVPFRVSQALIRHDPEAVAATPLTRILDFADLILDRDGRPSLGKSQGRRTAVLTNQG